MWVPVISIQIFPKIFINPVSVSEKPLTRVGVRSQFESSSKDAHVRWLCGDVEISPSTFSHMTVVSVDDQHSLIINDVRLLDTAQYTCIAKNDFGECQCSTDILVLRKFPYIFDKKNAIIFLNSFVILHSVIQ